MGLEDVLVRVQSGGELVFPPGQLSHLSLVISICTQDGPVA